MSLRLALLALLAPGCGAFGTCQEVREDGPGLTGTLVYVLGDGTRLEATLEDSWIALTGNTEVTIQGRFRDAFARDRHYTLRITDLAPGLLDVTGRGAFCLVRQTGSPPVCSGLSGTIDVRQLAYDCYQHESGISSCAETHELELHITSLWEETRFEIHGSDLTIGSWVDTECSD
jgi:hypothetical protein